MGGKSRSSQATTNQQTTSNHVNDGQFAGASNVDASRTDIDYRVDNSVDYELKQDIDNSVRNDYDLDQDIDNSLHYDLDQDIDNSVRMDGEMAGNNGVINVLDGGAIETSAQIALAGMDAATDAMRIGGNLGEHALSEMGNTVDEMAGLAGDSLAFAESGLSYMSDVSGGAFDAITKASENNAAEMAGVTGDALNLAAHGFDEMSDVSQASINANSDVSLAAIDGMGQLNADLAESYLGAISAANANNAAEMAGVTTDSLNAVVELGAGMAQGLSDNYGQNLELMGDLSAHYADGFNQSLDTVAGLSGSMNASNQAFMSNALAQMGAGMGAGLEHVSDFSADALANLADSNSQNLGALSGFAGDMLQSNQQFASFVTEQLGNSHAKNLGQLADTQTDISSFLADATESNIKANTAALERVAALSKSASLQGQDLVADSATTMIRYVSIAMGVGVAAIALMMLISKGSK